MIKSASMYWYNVTNSQVSEFNDNEYRFSFGFIGIFGDRSFGYVSLVGESSNRTFFDHDSVETTSYIGSSDAYGRLGNVS